MINIADFLDAQLDSKTIPTEQQIKEEYDITDDELAIMQSRAFEIPTAENCTCEHCGNKNERPGPPCFKLSTNQVLNTGTLDPGNADLV